MSSDQYLINGHQFKWGPGRVTLNPEKSGFLQKYSIGKVLDVACGSGIYSNFIHDLGHDVTGIDNQKEFINKALRNYKEVKFEMGNATKLKYPKDAFDTVVLFDILEHLDDQTVIREAARIGRRVIISVPRENQDELLERALSHSHYLDSTHLRTYTVGSLKKLLVDAGLKVVYCKEVLPISVSGFVIDRLSRGSQVRKLLLKVLLKPFLPEPPIFSTVFAVADRINP